MSDTFSRDFLRFTQENLRPAIEALPPRKRIVFKAATAVGLGMFAVFSVAAYLYLSPYKALIAEYNITYWPLVFLMPLSLGVIGFSIVYILGLCKMVTAFQQVLAERLGAFIDPNLSHESVSPRLAEESVPHPLPPGLEKATYGRDRFLGQIGDAAITLVELQKRTETGAAQTLSGVCLIARFPRRFEGFFMLAPARPVDKTAMTAALREAGLDMDAGALTEESTGRSLMLFSGTDETLKERIQAGGLRRASDILSEKPHTELYVSCFGNTLAAAALSPCGPGRRSWVFDSFELARCQAFCHDAKVLLDMAKKISDTPGVLTASPDIVGEDAPCDAE